MSSTPIFSSTTTSPIALVRVPRSEHITMATRKVEEVIRKKISFGTRSQSNENIDIEMEWLQEVKRVYPILAKKIHNCDSQFVVGLDYLYGEGNVSRNNHKAFFWLKKAAESGKVEAQYLVGSFYMHGVIVDRNINQAEKFLQQAATHGNHGARKLLKDLNVIKLHQRYT